jgi:hypothetical protein
MLQLELVLGVSRHVCPTTMVVLLVDITRPNDACLPLQIRVVLNWVEAVGVPAVSGRRYEHRTVSTM